MNAPPYYFACDLEDEIDQNTCVVIVDSHGVEFKCKKFQPGKRWGRLMRFVTPQTKNDIARRRLVSVQATYGRANVSRAAAVALSAEEGKAQLTKQWKLNQKHRNIIQERAEAELTTERNIARSWRQGLKALEHQIHVSASRVRTTITSIALGTFQMQIWTAWKRCNITCSPCGSRQIIVLGLQGLQKIRVRRQVSSCIAIFPNT